MKRKIMTMSMACVLALTIGVFAVATRTLADGPRAECPDVWRPVICSNGQIYSNLCYAHEDKATGCVPWGDDASR